MQSGRLNLGLVIPESGPSGIFGPSCRASAMLAVDELNAHGGILGREVALTTIDGGWDPAIVAAVVGDGVDSGRLDAIVGWHTSAVRRELVRVIEGRIPYVYTAVYEGGDRAPGVFMTGEVPKGQLVPALEWLSAERGTSSWLVVGSDYVWPRQTVLALGQCLGPARIRDRGGVDVRFAAARFLALGTDDFGPILDEIERSGVDGVLVLLLGEDAVRFNRAFADRGLHHRFVRLSSLMDENMLLASGGAAEEFYSVSGFFESLTTPHSMDFATRYLSRPGSCAPPLTSPGESCYEGMTLLSELSRRAGSLDVEDIGHRASLPFHYESPRGVVRFDGANLDQDVYLAKADGLEFDIVAQVGSL